MSGTIYPGPSGEYQLQTGTDLGEEQLGYLETLLDGPTMATLDTVGVRPGHRCLELGAGTGSIARRLAERVGPAGRVVAVDVDTRRLGGLAGVEVREHDVNDGVPGGPYDLIHARLLLMHLSRRREILRELAAALAPGGALVIGEYTGPQRYVIAAPSAADAELSNRVQRVGIDLAHGGGISYEWAFEVPHHMIADGLTGVSATDHRHLARGGAAACRLNWNYVCQIRERLLAAGMTADELDRYGALMHDPRFSVWFFPLVYTHGRKSAG